MQIAVIIPFLCQSDTSTLQWTMEGFAQQQLTDGHVMHVLVGIDGGIGNEFSLPMLPDDRFKVIFFPRIGVAAVRNALVRQTSSDTDLLIFTHADTRPDPGMVQCHVDTMEKLPQGSLVLGSAPRTGASPVSM